MLKTKIAVITLPYILFLLGRHIFCIVVIVANFLSLPPLYVTE